MGLSATASAASQPFSGSRLLPLGAMLANAMASINKTPLACP
jgi:hypothetical protein